jgi:uncharacterized protein YecT (DUF1311 family)
MPQMNLSALNGQELRRLLDASRARGDAPLAYQILQEMAVRRDSRQERGRSLLRRSPEPKVVAFNLGDPPEAEDELPPMPKWRAPEPKTEASTIPAAEPEPTPSPRRSRRSKAQPTLAAAPAAEPEPTLPLKPPRSVWDDDPPPPPDENVTEAEGSALRLDRPGRDDPGEPRRFRRPPGLGFAAGIVVGAAVGWWAAGTLPSPSPPAGPVAAQIRTAALEPQPVAPAPLPVTVAAAEPQPVPAPTPETPPEPTGGPLPPDLQEGPLLSPDAADEPVEQPPAAPPAVVRAASGGTSACAAEPTPADREICGDPDLRRLQRELRQAYAEALEAHEDRDLLRQRQLAWADARNTVTEPDRLARLYEQRIRKLNAATAEARRER